MPPRRTVTFVQSLPHCYLCSVLVALLLLFSPCHTVTLVQSLHSVTFDLSLPQCYFCSVLAALLLLFGPWHTVIFVQSLSHCYFCSGFAAKFILFSPCYTDILRLFSSVWLKSNELLTIIRLFMSEKLISSAKKTPHFFPTVFI